MTSMYPHNQQVIPIPVCGKCGRSWSMFPSLGYTPEKECRMTESREKIDSHLSNMCNSLHQESLCTPVAPDSQTRSLRKSKYYTRE
ncbi:hypothetical protein BGZ60DRAFT_407520 [Tricladium varicosporioides]|nr:hypothetical protein BGZ60DRAFT_407520 [Hymenoscyphus varicosporioides]